MNCLQSHSLQKQALQHTPTSRFAGCVPAGPNAGRARRASTALLLATTLLTATVGCSDNAAQLTSPAPPGKASLEKPASSLPSPNSMQAMAQDDFLPVDEAFQPELSIEDDAIAVVWSIAPEYYLYRHKFALAWHPGQGAAVALDDAAVFSRGLGKTDDYFGQVEVYYHQAIARIPRSKLGEGPGELEVQYQGCADAGLCYPVQTRRLVLR